MESSMLSLSPVSVNEMLPSDAINKKHFIKLDFDINSLGPILSGFALGLVE
jgi:hypothetical protein